MQRAVILTIGDELLFGSIVDTNAAHIGLRLTELGIQPVWTITVGDNAAAIRQAIELATTLAEVVLVTGGLGPTHDDVTKTVVAEATGRRLVFHQHLLDAVSSLFARRGLIMPESNRVQAYIPEGGTILDNPIGTAPGFLVNHHGAALFVMPGVPREMKRMMAEQVIPRLQIQSGGAVILHRVLKTTGIGESTLSELLEDIIAAAHPVKIASLPQEAGVNLRLTATAETQELAINCIAAVDERLTERAGLYIYGRDDETLEQVLGHLLVSAGATLAVAESCTGGLVTDRLTDISGSSVYFERGVVAYSNEAKQAHLGVSEKTLKTFGAVSGETASAMAEGVRKASGTTFGLSTTGIAGPTGATETKPVGLVYVSLAHAGGTVTWELRLGTDRRLNKVRAAVSAMNLLRLFLIDPALAEKGI